MVSPSALTIDSAGFGPPIIVGIRPNGTVRVQQVPGTVLVKLLLLFKSLKQNYCKTLMKRFKIKKQIKNFLTMILC